MILQQFFVKFMKRIGVTVRRENEGFFVRERYFKYLKDYEVVVITPYNIDYACDAYAILGGDDANPKLYNEENTASKGIDDLIDELDMKIIDYAVKTNKPIFGICRGLQMLNIYFGGSLKQHIDNHVEVRHNIFKTGPHSYFTFMDEVNSLHHQSINKLGEGLEVVYESIEGEIELVKHKTLPIFATQFHPEMEPESDMSKRCLEYFKSLFE